MVVDVPVTCLAGMGGRILSLSQRFLPPGSVYALCNPLLSSEGKTSELGYMIRQRWRDFADAIKSPNHLTLSYSKTDCPGWACPYHMSPKRENPLLALKTWAAMFWVNDVSRTWGASRCWEHLPPTKGWILSTTWMSLEVVLELHLRTQLGRHLDFHLWVPGHAETQLSCAWISGLQKLWENKGVLF